MTKLANGRIVGVTRPHVMETLMVKRQKMGV